jgi:hypothetical protein
MDVETAIETEIEPVLIDTFGASLGKCLMTLATLAYVTAGGGKTQRYRAFVDSVCGDERVVSQWGKDGAARQAKEWKDLVPLEPDTVVIVGQQSS